MTDLKNIVQNREIIYDVFNVTISVVIICNLKKIHSSENQESIKLLVDLF